MLQKDIINKLHVQPIIDPNKELKKSINILVNYLMKHLFLHTLVLGISGGQDSTLTGKICQLAIDKLREKTSLKYYQFVAVFMPYGKQKDEIDCNTVLNFIKPDKFLNINIKNSVLINESMLQDVGITLNNFSKINIKTRERMKILYSIAYMVNGLVVGTSNASEIITGFFTKYGDGGTDINPIAHLNKRQGKSLLKHLNCPKHLYCKSPIVDFGEDQLELLDEKILGINYSKIDDYLEGKSISKEDVYIIENLYKRNKHKHNLPISFYDV